MALLLGPPGAGKTTLLQALAGNLDPNLKVHSLINFVFMLGSTQFNYFLSYHILSHKRVLLW